MATVWEEFGIAVAKARAAKKWSLAGLADAAFHNPDRKGYVSQIEKGRTKLQFGTVQKLATALDLPASVTDPVFRADLPTEDVVAAEDRTAERLMRVSEADASVAPPSEALLISLAYEFARGSHSDLMAAHNGLRAALSEAADLKARGALPQNTSEQVTTVLRRVAELNDQGLREEAGAEVDTAIADLDASHAAQKAALTEIALRQDRIRNDPEAAAKRLLTQLRSVAHPGGLFRAIHDTWEEWFDRGHKLGIGFDLNTALNLARANVERSKGAQHVQAMTDLGVTQFELGCQEGRNERLSQSIASFRTVVASVEAKAEPDFRAAAMTNLAMVLRELGERETSTARLEEAIKTCRAALINQSRNRNPLNWARTQRILGGALRTLGEREPGIDRLEEAVGCLRAAVEVLTPNHAVEEWAATQGNLGNALQALGKRDSGTAYYEAAVDAYAAGLEKQPRETVPLDWASSQNNLGNVLWRWGARENGTTRIVEAITAHGLALEEWTRDRVPLDWATAWGNMGEAMTLLADRTDDLALARQALQQLEEAEAVLREAEHEVFARYSADRIHRAKAVIKRLS